MTPEHVRRIFQNVPGLFLVLRPDAAFTIVAASDEYLRTTHTDAGIFGRSVFEVFPPNPEAPQLGSDRALRASLERVVTTRRSDTMPTLRYDVRLDGAGGQFQERFWNGINAPVLSDAGEVEFIVHRVEEAAAKARRDAVAILESIGEGFFTLDRRWRFDYVNPEAHRILERTPGSLEGQVVWDAYPGLESTDFGRVYRHTMAAGEAGSITAFYPALQRWYEVSTFPAPEGISVYFRDVTGPKTLAAERERLIIESERQRRIYETALSNTPDFVYVFDVEHRALYANEALRKVWGVEDVLGKRWMDLGYAQWHADMHDAEIDTVIRTRAPIRGEIPFTGTNGTRIYDYIFVPVTSPDGEVVAVAGTTRDVTDRKSAEQAVREQAERLAASDRAKDEFLATLSHELRNPLAPLRNSIEMLRRIPAGDPRAPSIHAVMQRQVDHMVRLVDDLLELSRISRGTLSLRREPVELSAVVHNAVETSEPLIQAARHALTLELPPERLWVDGDPVRLAQVLANLLNNAAKYTEEGGRIIVSARREGDQGVVSVRDNGAGIVPEALPRMFEMFSRGERDSGRTQGGLGVGLALSRRLAEMHQGTLEGRSEGLGHGSEFIVRLPLAAGPQAPAVVVERAADGALHQARVLVVDDNQDAGDSLGQVLAMLGAQVRVVRDGPQALEAFPQFRPGVVLLDIGMPGMNGYDVARAIRSRFPDHRATLVALTGWGQEDDRRRAREAGFDHHLVKPAEIEPLQRLLQGL